MRLGGEGFETRVVDGLLEDTREEAMLGYLNAPSPFNEDGWFRTGDAVEVKGDYLKILGRTSEIINVGGEKVYPSEVESVLQLMPEVAGVVVGNERNALLGNIVKAKVRLSEPMDIADFRRRMREFCRDRLQPFKIPQKVELIGEGRVERAFQEDPERTADTQLRVRGAPFIGCRRRRRSWDSRLPRSSSLHQASGPLPCRRRANSRAGVATGGDLPAPLASRRGSRRLRPYGRLHLWRAFAHAAARARGRRSRGGWSESRPVGRG